MSFGERVALEGLLCSWKPRLSIEIGTATGGSLRRIAAHSHHVHSFDIIEPPDRPSFSNVTFHVGDSHELLPNLLKELESRGETVDFVLVDGDHSVEGVWQDIHDLLESRAVRCCLIVLHDTMNPAVRAGAEAIRYRVYPKVAYVHLDFVAGNVYKTPTITNELWGGLGLVIVDSALLQYGRRGVVEDQYHSIQPIMADFIERLNPADS